MTSQESIIEPSRKWVGRVAAEFVVIVLGVLVALAVDRYVGVRAEGERATEALRALEEDLVASAEALRATNRGYNRQSRTLTWLVDFPTDGSVQFPADSIRRVRLAAYQTSSYSPILRTHEALVSTGSLDLLGSEIQFALADISRLSANYLNYRAQTTDTWLFTLMPVYMRVLGAEPTSSEVVAALQDREFHAAMLTRGRTLGLTATQGETLAAQMDSLLVLVGVELAAR